MSPVVSPGLASEAPSPVLLTAKAAEMVTKAMQEDEGYAGLGLRIGVIGGGCSGLQYLLGWVEKTDNVEDDFVSQQHGVEIHVDQFSAGHLAGTTVDYVDGLQGSGFKFQNPNIQKSCGCGSSFST